MRDFPHDASHAHGVASTFGYAVRRTSLAPLNPDLGDVLTTRDYGAALEAARAERAAGDGCWAVIDFVYDCGCRGLG